MHVMFGEESSKALEPQLKKVVRPQLSVLLGTI